MKKTSLLVFTLLLIVGLTTPTKVHAQARNLTFVVNTATVPDTVSASYNVVLVGSGTGSADTALTSWGSGKAMTNIGGDYWKRTFTVNQGDTLKYKIRIGAGGWEKDLSDGFLAQGHRNYKVGSSDTTFPLQFWNNAQTSQPQYFRPWTAAPDTFINVYFRVNMQAVMDNGSFGWKPADVDSVGVRGAGKSGDDLSWGQTFYLKKENPPGDGGNEFRIPPGTFFSGRLKFRKNAWNVGDTVEYKFLLGWNWGRDELQGGAPNRKFFIPAAKNDTTLRWVFFNNSKPIARANSDTCVVTFVADMTTAIQKASFSIGDTVQVKIGDFSTADSTRYAFLIRQGLTNRYQATVTMLSKIGSPLDYQYFLYTYKTTIREYYYNFQYTGIITAEAERRQFTVSSGKTFTIKDTAVSVTSGRRQPYFENQRKINKNVAVTWKVDLRPAYYTIKLSGKTLTDIQGSYHITPAVIDSIKKWGVVINGPATGGWAANWGFPLFIDTTRKMYDDGTHGDAVANDSIYTRVINYKQDTSSVGQVFKFGIRGGDNESAFGLNHLSNIDDTNPTFTLDEQFGSINPLFYQNWDFTNKKPILTGVEQLSTLPESYSLQQNYPNPFNPATTIEFSLPLESNVTLTVYNLLGQAVATLVNENLKAGTHAVTFDAAKLSTGIYFYRISAGDFVSLKKMVLLK